MTPEQSLYTWFDTHSINLRLVEHAATHTVEQGLAMREGLDGGHSKSLLVEDKNGDLALLVALGTIRVDLKRACKELGAKSRFSFAKEERMLATLGVRPGHASPLCLINDQNKEIQKVVLDSNLIEHSPIWCHPLRNTASVALTPDDLKSFIEAHHGPAIVMDLAVSA